MKLTEISRSATPEKFYVEQNQYGVWLDNKIIYADASGVRLRRKAADGWQDIEVRQSDWSMHLWHVWVDEQKVEQSEEVAIGQIFLEYLDWDLDVWTTVTFDTMTVSLGINNAIQINLGMVSDPNINNQINIEWTADSAKQTYVAAYPGERIRVRCKVQMLNPDKPVIDYSDYNLDLVGDITVDDSGTLVRHLTFASDGVMDQIEVDPYIALDTQSTYVDVDMDGAVLRIMDGVSTYYFARLYTPSMTQLCNFTDYIRPSGISAHNFSYSAPILTVVENSKTRAIIEQSGNLYLSGSPMSGSTSVKHRWVIYPDRITHQFIWDISTSITITNIAGWNHFLRFAPISANLTSEINIAEISGVEKYHEEDGVNNPDIMGVRYDPTTTDYIGFTSDEVDLTFSLIEISDGDGQLYPESTAQLSTGFYDATLSAGTHTLTTEIVIDAAGRENGSKLYGSAGRLQLGGQFRDSALPLTTGSPVTNVSGLTAIGTSGMQSDGAWHFEGASSGDPVKLTWDRTRHIPVIVYHQDAGGDAPTMEVNGSAVTLYDPDTEAYNSTHYHIQDISGGAQWLLTPPADSNVTTSDTWEINPGAAVTPVLLTGSIDAVSNITGNLSKFTGLTGSVDSTSNLSGNLSKITGLSSGLSASSNITGNLSKFTGLTGSIDATTGIQNSIAITRGLSGGLDATADISGTLSVLGTVLLSGDLSASTDINGALSVDKSLSGSLSATTDISGTLTAIKQLSGLLSGSADITGSLTVDTAGFVNLSGNLSAMSTIQAALGIDKGLSGSVDAVSNVDGTVSLNVGLTGSVDAISNLAGNLTVVAESSLGVVIDPTIESVTKNRIIESITITRVIESI